MLIILQYRLQYKDSTKFQVLTGVFGCIIAMVVLFVCCTQANKKSKKKKRDPSSEKREKSKRKSRRHDVDVEKQQTRTSVKSATTRSQPD